MQSKFSHVFFLHALGFIAALTVEAHQTSPTAPRPAPAAVPRPITLFTNVVIFDGKSASLSPPSHVLVHGKHIEKISPATNPIEHSPETVVIDGKGCTLMPGLIDAHVHLMMESIPLSVGMTADPGYAAIIAADAAEKQLLRGFTSVRDAGGASFGLKRAIDEGLVAGPRVYPSGATISQTSGHGDFRTTADLPREPGAPLTHLERNGMTAIADGVDAVLKSTRENLMRGATQIKVMAGGGVASDYDPLDVTQYTLPELQAAVDAAAGWGTYVTVHAYTAKAVQTAIQAGVKCIEHGNLVDEATVKMMAKNDVWWCLQPFLDDEDAIPFPEGSANRAKQIEMTKGTANAYALAKKHNVKTAFGTDTLFDANLATRQGRQLAKLQKWYSPAEVLTMATSTNAELLALCGKRNPYPGTLGVVQEGALADLLLVNGNPLENLELVADPEANFLIIMKDGKIYKNTAN